MPSQRYVFVGTYTEPIRFGTGQILEGKGQGIYIYRLDPGTGALTPAGLATGVRNPSYLTFAASGRFLYAVNELKEFEGGVGGAVRAFALDPETGGLAFLNSKPTRGTDPCPSSSTRRGAGCSSPISRAVVFASSQSAPMARWAIPATLSSITAPAWIPRGRRDLTRMGSFRILPAGSCSFPISALTR